MGNGFASDLENQKPETRNQKWAWCVAFSGFWFLVSGFLTSGLLTSCATGPPVTAPDLKSVPAIAIEAACTKLRNEGLTGESTLVVKKTEPSLITGASLRSVAHSYSKDLDASSFAATIGSMVQSTPLDFRATSCKWQTI